MTNELELQDAIKEWFDALTGEIAQLSACRPVSSCRQTAQQSCASLSHASESVAGQLMGWLLAAGSIAILTFYLAQSIDWPTTGVNLLLKVVSWL